jgi:hypothetical protein
MRPNKNPDENASIYPNYDKVRMVSEYHGGDTFDDAIRYIIVYPGYKVDYYLGPNFTNTTTQVSNTTTETIISTRVQGGKEVWYRESDPARWFPLERDVDGMSSYKISKS